MTPVKIKEKPKSEIAKNASKLKSIKLKNEKQHLKGVKMSSSTLKSKNVQDIRGFFETLQAGQKIEKRITDKVDFGAARQANNEVIPRPTIKSSRVGGISNISSNSPTHSKEHQHIKPRTGLRGEKGSLGHKTSLNASRGNTTKARTS